MFFFFKEQHQHLQERFTCMDIFWAEQDISNSAIKKILKQGNEVVYTHNILNRNIYIDQNLVDYVICLTLQSKLCSPKKKHWIKEKQGNEIHIYTNMFTVGIHLMVYLYKTKLIRDVISPSRMLKPSTLLVCNDETLAVSPLSNNHQSRLRKWPFYWC